MLLFWSWLEAQSKFVCHRLTLHWTESLICCADFLKSDICLIYKYKYGPRISILNFLNSCIIYINLHKLRHLCISGMKASWPWLMIQLICSSFWGFKQQNLIFILEQYFRVTVITKSLPCSWNTQEMRRRWTYKVL